MDDRRREKHGRRESDRLRDIFWRELDTLRGDLRRDLDRLEHALDRLDDDLQKRVDELEAFRTEETAHALGKVATRTRRVERYQTASIVGGLVGVLAGLLEAAHRLGWL